MAMPPGGDAGREGGTRQRNQSTMTPREQRTVRLGAIFIAVMVAAFFGFLAWKRGSRQRVEYRQLRKEAEDLKAEVKRYDDRIAVVKKLMENFHMDPAKLEKTTIVAEASSAIQKAAAGGGFQLRSDPRNADARGGPRTGVHTIRGERAGESRVGIIAAAENPRLPAGHRFRAIHVRPAAPRSVETQADRGDPGF